MVEEMTIQGCGLHRVIAEVPARETATMDVVVWTEQVLGAAVGADHAARSPHCTARTMSEVMIPIDGAQHVGGPVVN